MLFMKTFNDTDVLNELRRVAGDNQAEWARRHYFSRSFVCQVLAEKSPVTEKLAHALGFRMVNKRWEKRLL